MAVTATAASLENRLINYRESLGGMLQGSGHPRVLFVGDSKMMGAGAGTGTPGFTEGAAPKRKTQVLASLLSGVGVPALDQAFLGDNMAPDPALYDTRVSLGNGWSWQSGILGIVFGGRYAQNTGGGSGNLSFSPVGTFDRVDVVYAQGPGAGEFTVSDGATLCATIDAVNATATAARQTVTLASRGSGKTINIARSSGNIYIFAVIAYDSTTPSILLLNAGNLGSTSTTWQANATFGPGGNNGWDAFAPDLTVIALGANDKNNGIPVSTFKSNIQALITRAQRSGDVVLVDEAYGNGGFNNNSAEFRQALLELARENDCFFHDEAARVNYQSNPTWFADSIHEKDFAHADEARAYLSFLLPHLI